MRDFEDQYKELPVSKREDARTSQHFSCFYDDGTVIASDYAFNAIEDIIKFLNFPLTTDTSNWYM